MESERVLGIIASFFVVFMVVGAGIVLVLNTLGGARQLASAAVLAFVVVIVAVTAALASNAEPSISNPYW